MTTEMKVQKSSSRSFSFILRKWSRILTLLSVFCGSLSYTLYHLGYVNPYQLHSLETERENDHTSRSWWITTWETIFGANGSQSGLFRENHPVLHFVIKTLELVSGFVFSLIQTVIQKISTFVLPWAADAPSVALQWTETAGVYISNFTANFVTLIKTQQLDVPDVLKLLTLTAFVVLVMGLLSKLGLRKSKKQESSQALAPRRPLHEVACYREDIKHVSVFSWLNMLKLFFPVCVLWEVICQYQIEEAKKAAVVTKGIPPECLPNHTWWQWLKGWSRSTFSWAGDPCEAYYKAALVNPLWEANPLKAVFSLIFKIISLPFYYLPEAVGTGFHGLMQKVPAQWQIVLVFISVLFLVLLLVTCCRYRVTVFPLFKFEPADTGRPQSNNHQNTAPQVPVKEKKGIKLKGLVSRYVTARGDGDAAHCH